MTQMEPASLACRSRAMVGSAVLAMAVSRLDHADGQHDGQQRAQAFGRRQALARGIDGIA